MERLRPFQYFQRNTFFCEWQQKHSVLTLLTLIWVLYLTRQFGPASGLNWISKSWPLEFSALTGINFSFRASLWYSASCISICSEEKRAKIVEEIQVKSLAKSIHILLHADFWVALYKHDSESCHRMQELYVLTVQQFALFGLSAVLCFFQNLLCKVCMVGETEWFHLWFPYSSPIFFLASVFWGLVDRERKFPWKDYK